MNFSTHARRLPCARGARLTSANVAPNEGVRVAQAASEWENAYVWSNRHAHVMLVSTMATNYFAGMNGGSVLPDSIVGLQQRRNVASETLRGSPLGSLTRDKFRRGGRLRPRTTRLVGTRVRRMEAPRSGPARRRVVLECLLSARRVRPRACRVWSSDAPPRRRGCRRVCRCGDSRDRGL